MHGLIALLIWAGVIDTACRVASPQINEVLLPTPVRAGQGVQLTVTPSWAIRDSQSRGARLGGIGRSLLDTTHFRPLLSVGTHAEMRGFLFY